MKLRKVTKMCLNATCSRVQVGKHLSHIFPNENGVKKRNTSLPLVFNSDVEYAITRVQVHQDDLKLNGTYQLLVYADDNILGASIHTVKKDRCLSSC